MDGEEKPGMDRERHRGAQKERESTKTDSISTNRSNN